ncbi:unnamed protein product, partial [Ectocarpus sp. 12 AP-2014]
ADDEQGVFHRACGEVLREETGTIEGLRPLFGDHFSAFGRSALWGGVGGAMKANERLIVQRAQWFI